jgi:N-methylhydantoinase B
MQALADAVPERLLAASGSTPLWYLNFSGRRGDLSHFYSVVTFHGGLGARARRDGISSLSYPSNVATIPLEVIESEAPVIFETKTLATDSVGHGRQRGGFGQRVEIRIPSSLQYDKTPIVASVRGGRFGEPIRGVYGGFDAPDPVVTLNGDECDLTSQIELAAGDLLSLTVPGGGGYGNPRERAKNDIEADISQGLLTEAVAWNVYGHRREQQ